MSDEKKGYAVTFHFENEEIARLFLGWMSNSGEQDVCYSTEDEGGHITFDYHTMNNGNFGPNVNCTWHELDDDEVGDAPGRFEDYSN